MSSVDNLCHVIPVREVIEVLLYYFGSNRSRYSLVEVQAGGDRRKSSLTDKDNQTVNVCTHQSIRSVGPISWPLSVRGLNVCSLFLGPADVLTPHSQNAVHYLRFAV